MSDLLATAIGNISFDEDMIDVINEVSDNKEKASDILQIPDEDEKMLTEFLQEDKIRTELPEIDDLEEMLQLDEEMSEENMNRDVLNEIHELNEMLKLKQMTVSRSITKEPSTITAPMTEVHRKNTREPIIITVPADCTVPMIEVHGSSIKILQHEVNINGVIVKYDENEMTPIISIISKVFHCDMCNKDFTKSGSFIQHNNTHHSGKEYKCVTCGKRFETEEVLNSHKKNHEETAKNFMCPQCPKGYVHKSDLKRHVLTHVGNDKKPFHCDECSKGFTRNDHLVNHKKSHARKIQLKFVKMQKNK